MAKFTKLKVDELTQTAGRYCDGGGLWLFVSSARSASWIFRYSIDGVQKDMGLGSLRAVSLKDARQAAEKARALRAQGKDPKAEREEHARQRRLETSRRMTFQQCAENYLKLRTPKWRNGKYAAQVPSVLRRFAYPVIGMRPVQEVTTEDVVKIIEPLWMEKYATATKLRGQIEAVLNWATSVGHRTGENPARLKGHLEFHLISRPKGEPRHHAALPYQELPAFLKVLEGQPGLAALALRFTVLTAARTGESIGARWEEIDRAQALWDIPAGRMKSGRKHRVPLSTAATAVLDAVALLKSSADAGFVFEGEKKNRPLSNMAMLALLKRMGRSDLTVHGFRASFRSWAGEKASFPWEVCEMALAHTVADATEAAYYRTDLVEKRRELMQGWANYCTSNAAAVIPLRAAV